jgi:hypothetical protein
MQGSVVKLRTESLPLLQEIIQTLKKAIFLTGFFLILGL